MGCISQPSAAPLVGSELKASHACLSRYSLEGIQTGDRKLEHSSCLYMDIRIHCLSSSFSPVSVSLNFKKQATGAETELLEE